MGTGILAPSCACAELSVIPHCHDVRMTTSSGPHADGAGQRKSLPPAMLAALWTVSNGRCYAPGCIMPVVLEVRPGVYQKNSQVAHIYGVRPGAPRYRRDMPAGERDSFANLLLLCTAHHEEVDGPERTAIRRIPSGGGRPNTRALPGRY